MAKKDENKEQELQNKMMQFQASENTFKIIRERVQQVALRSEEFQHTRQALEEMKKTKPSDSLIPIGSGAYVKGKVEKTDEVLTTIGAGLLVKKSREDAIKFIEERIKEAHNVLQQLSLQEQQISAELTSMQQEIQKSLSGQSA